MKQSALPLIVCLAGLALGGCAGNQAQPDDGNGAVAYDPLESVNRKIYLFNGALDRVALKPLARGYRKVVPKSIRRGFSNVFANLGTPRSALNNFLQGKPRHGFNELGRFLFNSTIGIGGVFDVASAGGLEPHSESFGETLAVWGMPEGPYLVLPFFGPHSALSAGALPVDFYTDLNPHLDTSVRDRLYFFRTMDTRVRLLSAESLLDKSNDPYIALRESFLQNRAFRVYDGDPPDGEDDAFNEEIFDDYFDDE